MRTAKLHARRHVTSARSTTWSGRPVTTGEVSVLCWATRFLYPAALLSAVPLLTSRPAWAIPLTAVVSNPENVQIKLDSIATLTGLVPIDAATIPGNRNLYVGTYVASTAAVRVIDPATKTISAMPFLTFAGTGVPIAGQGLQGITFSPNFNDNSKPGYRKFYTYQAETGPGATNTMFMHPEVVNPSMVGVVREWTANSAGTAVNSAIASRVVFNFGTPGGHMGGGMKFGPDGFLYLATGDGGGNGDGGSTSNNTDGFTGRNPAGTSTDVPGISNGQDFTNVLGKVIRIDPYVTNADGSPRDTPEGASTKSSVDLPDILFQIVIRSSAIRKTSTSQRSARPPIMRRWLRSRNSLLLASAIRGS